MRYQLPQPRVDVEVAIGEGPLRHRLVAVVAVLEVDEEVLRGVPDDGDILRANWKLMADGPLDDLRLHHRPVPP